MLDVDAAAGTVIQLSGCQ